MFFALSGFLVAGSLERCRTMVSFAGLRIIRIFPALVVETLLSAFILGPILTHFDLSSYFSDPEFRTYMLNMLGLVNFNLPGLFLANPLPKVVNAQLWTVPYELRCYEVLILISLLGFYARKWLLPVTIVLLTLLMAVKAFYTDNYSFQTLTGNELVLCFLCGVMLFRFRDSVVWNLGIASVALLAAFALSSFTGGSSFIALPTAYLTVYLGLLNPPRVKWLFSGDYSYGLFLYGFPVQQAIVSSGSWAHHWYITLGVGLPLTVMIAVSSWWLIEKPILTRKRWLIALEDKALAAAGSGRAWWARRAAGRAERFDTTTVGPAENRDS